MNASASAIIVATAVATAVRANAIDDTCVKNSVVLQDGQRDGEQHEFDQERSHRGGHHHVGVTGERQPADEQGDGHVDDRDEKTERGSENSAAAGSDCADDQGEDAGDTGGERRSSSQRYNGVRHHDRRPSVGRHLVLVKISTKSWEQEPAQPCTTSRVFGRSWRSVVRPVLTPARAV